MSLITKLIEAIKRFLGLTPEPTPTPAPPPVVEVAPPPVPAPAPAPVVAEAPEMPKKRGRPSKKTAVAEK